MGCEEGYFEETAVEHLPVGRNHQFSNRQLDGLKDVAKPCDSPWYGATMIVRVRRHVESNQKWIDSCKIDSVMSHSTLYNNIQILAELEITSPDLYREISV